MDNAELLEKCEQDLYQAIYEAHRLGLPYESILFPLEVVMAGVLKMTEAEKSLKD